MSKKERDLKGIEQLLKKLARESKSQRSLAYLDRMTSIMNMLIECVAKISPKKGEPSNPNLDELLRYVPIALVSCMETYFKRVIQDLIDFQETYRARITQFPIEFGPGSVLAIYGENVTLGQFIAHNLSINNVQDIESHLGILLNENFLQIVRKKGAWADDPIPVVMEVFEKRHIVVHEHVISPFVTLAQSGAYLTSVSNFLDASEDVISKRAGPDPKDVGRRLMSLADARTRVVRERL